MGRAIRVAAAALLALAWTAPPAGAAAAGRWTLRGHGLWLLPSDDRATVVSEPPLAFERTSLEVADGSGFGLALEVRFAERWGAELAALLGDLEGRFELEIGPALLTDRETIDTRIVAVGVNRHLGPWGRVEPRIGAFAALSSFDGVTFLTEVGGRRKVSFDDDVGFGATLGLDAPFSAGGRWRLSAELRYLVTILESEVPGHDLDVDPWIPAVGVGYAF